MLYHRDDGDPKCPYSKTQTGQPSRIFREIHEPKSRVPNLSRKAESRAVKISVSQCFQLSAFLRKSAEIVESASGKKILAKNPHHLKKNEILKKILERKNPHLNGMKRSIMAIVYLSLEHVNFIVLIVISVQVRARYDYKTKIFIG